MTYTKKNYNIIIIIRDLNDNKELNGYVPLNSKISHCNYSNTNLCYLKSTTCKSSIPKCTIENINNTNKENGAPNNLINENEVPSSSMDFKKKLGIAGIVCFIMLVTIGYCGYKHRSKVYVKPLPINININNTNSNYNPAPVSNTTINNIYNTYNTYKENDNSYINNTNSNYNPTPVNNIKLNNINNTYKENNNSSCFEEAPPPYYPTTSVDNTSYNYTSNITPTEPPFISSTIYTPSAPAKY